MGSKPKPTLLKYPGGKKAIKNKIEIPMPFKMKCAYCRTELIEPATLTKTYNDEDGACMAFEAVLCCEECLQKQIVLKSAEEKDKN